MSTVLVAPAGRSGAVALFLGVWGLIVLVVMLAMGIPLHFAWIPLLAAATGLPVGLWRLLQRPGKGRAAVALALAALLAPAGVFLCIAMITAVPTAWGIVREATIGQKVALSAVSPDGQYKAYAVDLPSIDPPNQNLYIQRTGSQASFFITHLPEDYEGIRRIHWSPHSDIVVFETTDALLAVRVPGCVTVRIPWVGIYHGRSIDSQSFYSSSDRIEVTAVTFPQPGAFAYHVTDRSDPAVVNMSRIEPPSEMLKEPGVRPLRER